MMQSAPAHLLVPCPLLMARLGPADASARSWLGGAPRLGAAPWPVDEDGRALLHAAQIDLAEIAAKCPEAPLPKSGSLAFFIGGEGAVVFVPNHMAYAPSELPADALGLDAIGTWTWNGDAQGRPIFPHTAIDFTPLDVHIAGPIPDWWHIALFYARGLSRAVDRLPALLQENRALLETARQTLKMRQTNHGTAGQIAVARESIAYYQRRIAGFTRKTQGFEALFAGVARAFGSGPISPEQAFRNFVTDVTRWAEGPDPWSIMPPQDMDHLRDLADKGRDFRDFMELHAPVTFDDIKEKMFAALPRSGPAFDALPGSVRAVITEDRSPREAAEAAAVAKLVPPPPLLGSGRWHQIFGHGTTIQNAAPDNWGSGNYLLLQLNSDGDMHWDIGDAGAFQFWISPEDLAAQNWSRVELTSECH